MLRTLVIDDESLAREEMRRLLAAHREIVIVGEAEDVPTARARLATADYDVVLLDIQLAGGSGFDLVPHVAPAARIVFVTAHDEFALRAFDVNALDYLLKPVSTTRLASSLARLTAARTAPPTQSETSPTADSPELMDRPLGALTPEDRVYLKNDRMARFVPLNAIAAVISCDNYSEVLVADGARFLVRRPLKNWEAALPLDAFVRVHRQSLVNLALIEAIDDPDGDTPSLRVRGVRQPIACSHRLTPELRRRLSRA